MLVFLSHAGADTWVARQLEAHIKAVGADTFLDEANIGIGERFPEVVREQLDRADELLVLLTPWSLQRQWIWVEIGAAFQRDIPIIVALHGLSPEDLRQNTAVPIFLLERNIVELNEINRYFEELRTRVGGT